jgi:hypothetical protein
MAMTSNTACQSGDHHDKKGIVMSDKCPRGILMPRVTRERIRQRQKRALTQMRKALRK